MSAQSTSIILPLPGLTNYKKMKEEFLIQLLPVVLRVDILGRLYV